MNSLKLWLKTIKLICKARHSYQIQSPITNSAVNLLLLLVNAITISQSLLNLRNALSTIQTEMSELGEISEHLERLKRPLVTSHRRDLWEFAKEAMVVCPLSLSITEGTHLPE